jgi:hypothetical protein
VLYKNTLPPKAAKYSLFWGCVKSLRPFIWRLAPPNNTFQRRVFNDFAKQNRWKHASEKINFSAVGGKINFFTTPESRHFKNISSP